MADSQDSVTDKQSTNTKSITEVYAFERGKHYVIEVDKRYMSMEQIGELSDLLSSIGIKVTFVPTFNGHALRPIPAIEGIDLAAADSKPPLNQANPPKGAQ